MLPMTYKRNRALTSSRFFLGDEPARSVKVRAARRTQPDAAARLAAVELAARSLAVALARLLPRRPFLGGHADDGRHVTLHRPRGGTGAVMLLVTAQVRDVMPSCSYTAALGERHPLADLRRLANAYRETESLAAVGQRVLRSTPRPVVAKMPPRLCPERYWAATRGRSCGGLAVLRHLAWNAAGGGPMRLPAWKLCGERPQWRHLPGAHRCTRWLKHKLHALEQYRCYFYRGTPLFNLSNNVNGISARILCIAWRRTKILARSLNSN